MKALLWVVGILVLLVGGFYALNAYIYHEKQGETAQFTDGEHLGFIHALTDNNTAMDFDDGLWLTGPAAYDAAIEAGICTRETVDECLPNGYFIQNDERKDERLAIDPNVLIIMQTWRMEETGEVTGREIALSDFAALVNDPSAHWRELPYTITVRENTVTRIEEVYIP